MGTAGSLVVAAAVLFVLGSAVVAFRGWPRMGTSGAAPTQVVTIRPLAGSRTERRLAAVEPVTILGAGLGVGVRAGAAERRGARGDGPGRVTHRPAAPRSARQTAVAAGGTAAAGAGYTFGARSATTTATTSGSSHHSGSGGRPVRTINRHSGGGTPAGGGGTTVASTGSSGTAGAPAGGTGGVVSGSTPTPAASPGSSVSHAPNAGIG